MEPGGLFTLLPLFLIPGLNPELLSVVGNRKKTKKKEKLLMQFASIRQLL